MSKNDGGPAFPYACFDVTCMTLRDYFAGQALEGSLADPNSTTAGLAAFCYRMADAMIAERAK